MKAPRHLLVGIASILFLIAQGHSQEQIHDSPVDLVGIISSRLLALYISYLSAHGLNINVPSQDEFNKVVKPIASSIESIVSQLGLHDLACTARLGSNVNQWSPAQEWRNPGFWNDILHNHPGDPDKVKAIWDMVMRPLRECGMGKHCEQTPGSNIGQIPPCNPFLDPGCHTAQEVPESHPTPNCAVYPFLPECNEHLPNGPSGSPNYPNGELIIPPSSSKNGIPPWLDPHKNPNILVLSELCRHFPELPQCRIFGNMRPTLSGPDEQHPGMLTPPGAFGPSIPDMSNPMSPKEPQINHSNHHNGEIIMLSPGSKTGLPPWLDPHKNPNILVLSELCRHFPKLPQCHVFGNMIPNFSSPDGQQPGILTAPDQGVPTSPGEFGPGWTSPNRPTMPGGFIPGSTGLYRPTMSGGFNPELTGPGIPTMPGSFGPGLTGPGSPTMPGGFGPSIPTMPGGFGPGSTGPGWPIMPGGPGSTGLHRPIMPGGYGPVSTGPGRPSMPGGFITGPSGSSVPTMPGAFGPTLIVPGRPTMPEGFSPGTTGEGTSTMPLGFGPGASDSETPTIPGELGPGPNGLGTPTMPGEFGPGLTRPEVIPTGPPMASTILPGMSSTGSPFIFGPTLPTWIGSPHDKNILSKFCLQFPHMPQCSINGELSPGSPKKTPNNLWPTMPPYIPTSVMPPEFESPTGGSHQYPSSFGPSSGAMHLPLLIYPTGHPPGSFLPHNTEAGTSDPSRYPVGTFPPDGQKGFEFYFPPSGSMTHIPSGPYPESNELHRPNTPDSEPSFGSHFPPSGSNLGPYPSEIPFGPDSPHQNLPFWYQPPSGSRAVPFIPSKSSGIPTTYPVNPDHPFSSLGGPGPIEPIPGRPAIGFPNMEFMRPPNMQPSSPDGVFNNNEMVPGKPGRLPKNFSPLYNTNIIVLIEFCKYYPKVTQCRILHREPGSENLVLTDSVFEDQMLYAICSINPSFVHCQEHGTSKLPSICILKPWLQACKSQSPLMTSPSELPSETNIYPSSPEGMYPSEIQYLPEPEIPSNGQPSDMLIVPGRPSDIDSNKLAPCVSACMGAIPQEGSTGDQATELGPGYMWKGSVHLRPHGKKNKGWYELWYNPGFDEKHGWIQVWNNKLMRGEWKKK